MVPTARQALVLDCIREFIADHGYPPTNGEIAQRLGMSSEGIRRHLLLLAKKGLVVRDGSSPRALRVLQPA